MNIGIVGIGVTGSALDRWLVEHTDHRVLRKDIKKGFNDDFYGIDCAFVCINAPNNRDGTQDINGLRSVINNLPESTPVFVRTTVLPGTCSRLRIESNKPVFSIPEFLTARRAYQDMCDLPIIAGVTGEYKDLVQKVFKDKKVIFMQSREAEMAKYTHNVFGAIKVNYFNIIKELCDKYGIDYNTVLDGAMLTGFINKEHTQIPGHDRSFGFGGFCLPKDLRAFSKTTSHFSKMLQAVESDNKYFRRK
jgi:UDPglucose 6-dehydrogenase